MTLLEARPRRPRSTPLTRSRMRAPGLDWPLLGATFGVIVFGVLLVWSATASNYALTHDHPTMYLKKDLINAIIGVVLFTLVLAVDHRWLRILTPVVYIGSLLGLVLVLVAGTTINGSRSWIEMSGMSIQPSEFAKLAVVIGSALLIAERVEGSRRRTVGTAEVLLLLGVAAIPAGLIMLQPDLGTMLVLAATVFAVLAVSGAPKTWMAGLFAGGVVVAVGVVALGLLKKYQVDRFLAFTNPGLDPRGAGYNVHQARVAIGNGGFFGQGIFDGSQTRSGFVPEQHTDFVFTVAGEEWGYLGAGLLVVLLGVIIWRALVISSQAEDMFGRIAAAGIACWFGFQAFQNIGMCLGIMPVTGVPLPLVSYGGSSMFAELMAIGLLQNIHLRGASPIPTRLLRQRAR